MFAMHQGFYVELIYVPYLPYDIDVESVRSCYILMRKRFNRKPADSKEKVSVLRVVLTPLLFDTLWFTRMSTFDSERPVGTIVVQYLSFVSVA